LLPLGWRLLPSYFCERGCTNDTRLYFRHDLPIGDGMANFKFLIGASLLVAAFGSHAGYAQVAPPSGLRVAADGVKTVVTGSSAANSWTWANSAARANGSFNLGGRLIKVPLYMRFAANAPRIIAAAVSLHPGIRFGIGVAAWLGAASLLWDETDQTWKKSSTVTIAADLYSDNPYDNVYSHDTPGAACGVYVGRWNAKKSAENAAYGLPPWIAVTFETVLVNGVWSCVGTSPDWLGATLFIPPVRPGYIDKVVESPISTDDVPDLLAANPLPQHVPEELPPGIAIPLDDPIINPSSDPDPVAKPLRVPLGEPVPVPNSDPAQWKIPVVDIVPAPLPADPWRVDVQPRDIVKFDPSPMSEPEIVTSNPPGQTSQDKAPGLCEQFPDILACQKPNFDTPDIDQIQTRDASITITPDSGWGADNAACPSARHLSGANVDFEFTTICNFMTGIRPVMIAVAWLMAAMILIGFKRGE